ncbi:MAG: right-handed parallel beta-helix repeat-containing protein, partial [Planctomycetota bacterium]
MNLTTRAFVGDDPTDATPSAGPGDIDVRGSMNVAADDRVEIDKVVGVLAVAAYAGIGAAAGVSTVDKTTEAFVGNNADVTVLGLSPLTVKTGEINISHTATGAATPGIEANGDVSLDSDSGTLKAQGEVGLADLDSINADQQGGNDANDQSLTSQRLATPTTTSFRGLAVTATNRDDIETYTISLAGGIAGVAISAGVNVINTNTNSYLGDGATINGDNTGANAAQDVLVASGNDFYHFALAGTLAAGVVGIAPAVGVTVLQNNTTAEIRAGVTLNVRDDVQLKAGASEDILLVGFGLAGGVVGIGGSVDVLSIDNTTTANITAATISAGGDVLVRAVDNTDLDVISGAVGGGFVGIGASVGVVTVDKVTNAVVGNGATIDALGGGSPVSGIFTGEQFGDGNGFNTASVRGLAVQADSGEDYKHLAIAAGVGFVGVAGGVSVTMIDSDTTALIDGGAMINQTGGNSGANSQQSVYVNAANEVRGFSFAGALAGGFVGVAGAVDVGSIKNDTLAQIGNGAVVTAENDVEVNALGIKDMQGFTFSGAGGAVALAAAISVWSVGETLDSNYSDNDGNSDNAVEGQGGASATDDATGQAETSHNETANKLANFEDDAANPNNSSTKQVGSITADAANRINAAAPTQAQLAAKLAAATTPAGTTARISGGATVTAGDDINVDANEDVEIDILVGGVAGGLVGVGAGVAVTSIAANTTASAGGTLTAGDDITVRARLDEDFNGSAFVGAGGFVGVGAAVYVVNDTTVVQALLANNATVVSADDVRIQALNNQDIEAFTGQVTVGAVAVGASFAKVNVGNSSAIETLSQVGNGARIGFGGAVDDVIVDATSNLNAHGEVFGLSGGIGAFSANFAFVDLEPEVQSNLGDNSQVTVDGDVVLTPTLNLNGFAEATGTSIGGLTIGATLASVTAGRGDSFEEVVARIGANSRVDSRTLQILPESHDDLTADTTAGAGGVISGTGAVSTLDTDVAVVARIAPGADIDVLTLSIAPDHQQDVDGRADSATIALGAGTGAFASHEITSRSFVDIQSGATRIDAQHVLINVVNYARKKEFGRSVRNVTVSGLSATGLGSSYELGTPSNPFEASVNIGSGVEVTTQGLENGLFNINTTTDFDLSDSVKATGVSGIGGVTVGVSDVETRTRSVIHVDGATLQNLSGDLKLATRGAGSASADANLEAASGLSANAFADANSDLHATQRIDLDDATLKGRNIDIWAGRGLPAQPNNHFSRAASNVFAASLGVNIVNPTASSTINETNVIDIQGSSQVLGFEDIDLITDETSLPDESVGIEGGAFSLSAFPYGVGTSGTEAFSSTNNVDVGNAAKVEAGIHSSAFVSIQPRVYPGRPTLPIGRLDTLLTTQEKGDLSLPVEIDYEYSRLDINNISLDLFDGHVIQVVGGANAGGTVGNFYQFNLSGFESVALAPHLLDYTSAVWTDLGVLTPAEITALEDDGSPVYPSDITLQLATGLTDKFYAIKPTEVEDIRLVYTNVGNRLYEEREKLISWISNHDGNAEAIARYQVQLDEINQQLADLGFTESVNGGTQFLRSLDVLILDLPEITAAPGSIFIEAGLPSTAVLPSQVGNQLVAYPGAQVNVLNNSPFAMEVGNILVRDNQRVTVGDNGQSLVLEGGNVYLNNSPLTNVVDNSARTIDILQDAYGPIGNYDLSGLPVTPAGIDQDLYINGDVVNEAGDVMIENREGSVYVNGEVRGENVTILAAANFTLNSEDWFHTNQDPRQYLRFEDFRAPLFNLGAQQQAAGLPIAVPPRVEPTINFTGRLQDGTTATLEQAIHRDESRILAQGRITITARFLNVDGLVQSGVTDIEFDVAPNFQPPQFVSNFTDDSGVTLPGISFGTDGVPIDGYWDPSRQAFVLEDIEPDGGQITIAGQLLSTGNGRLKVASGLTGLDIDNQSPFDLILGNIDTTKDRVGKITVIDSGLLTKTEYEVVGGQIRETDFTGTLNSGGTPAIIYTPVGSPVNYNFGDTIEYVLPAGLHYVWTEGQDKVQLDKRIYEKKTFNLFGDFLADELAADNDWKHREVINIDDEPLLESETRELENTNAPGGEELVPVYANGSAYSLRYEQRRDTSVELFTNISQVRHPPEPTGSVYLYIGADNPADLVLSTINYGDTNRWTNLSALDPGDAGYVDPATFTQDITNNRFDSSYVNSEKTIEGPECRGGGWLRTKTCTTKIDITTGLKDFYTHTLKADYPIGILFDQGPSAPITSIRSGGDILFEGNVQTPLVGNVTIESTNGDVTSVPGTVLFGPSPTVTAGGEVLLTVEGDRGPITVSAQGDIDLEAISLDNVSSSLQVGVLDSAEGDVFVNAANGIDASGVTSIVRGEVVELRATAGEIGDFDLPLPIDTSRSDGSIPPTGGEFPDPGQNGDARGGLVAVAQSDVRVREVLGDLVLTESDRDSSPSSVYSESGDVGITVTTGSLLDGVDELFRPSNILSTARVASDTLQFLQQGANQGLWNFESVNYSVSPGLATFLYPHANTLGTAPPSFAIEFNNIVGDRIEISTPNQGSDVGELQEIVSINDPANANALTVFQKDVLSVANASDVVGVQYELFEFVAADQANVDLLNENYADTARWQPIAINHRTGTTAATRTVSTNQTVLNQFDLDFFGLYRYLGVAAELDLFAQNYNDASLWQRLTADHATDSGTPSLVTGQLVADKHQVESLSVRLSDQVAINARTALAVTAHDRVAITAPVTMLIERIEAGGDTKLDAAASIVDLGIGDAAVATPASLEMRAGSQIVGAAASSPMRTQIGNAGLLRVDAVAGIDLVQVALDTTINGSLIPIDDLFVSRADSAMTIDITVDEGDLIVGRVLSSSDVILTAQSDIFDAFNDTGAEVVNVTTDNPNSPPSGDVTLMAGGQIGTATNYLDVSLFLGSLTSMSGGDQFVHSVRDIDVENMTSTSGSVSLRSEGLGDIGVIHAVAGDALVEARDEILDRDADAASDINAVNITLSSTDGRIGELLNDLEINTAGGGALAASARLDLNVTETTDSLTLSDVASTALGHVRLTVLESTASGEDLILPASGLISVADGALWLQVGDDITLAGPVTAPRSYLTGDYLDADAAGSNVTISGTFSGGNTLFLETSDGNDVIAISGVTVPTHIRTGGGDDDVTGGQNRDHIDGGAGIDLLRGGPGDDTLIAGSGIGNQLFGGDGNDLLVGSDDGAETDPNFADAVRFGDLIQGDAGDDRIYALGGADLILGGLGDDWIDAGPGSDNASGGDGDDTIFAGVGLNEFVDGGDDDDQIWGSNNGNDTLLGGPGSDDIRGQDGNDTINGGDGPDFIDGGAGTDNLRGGGGDDEILGGGGVGDQLRGEHGDDVLRGSDDGADLILGGAGRDRAFGGGGNDVIEGGPGNDILRGEAGDDTISGDSGSDVILGGADHDVLYALNVSAIGADGAVDYVYGDFGTNNDEPGSGGDQLLGDDGIDLLFGEGGDDLIDDNAQVAGIPTPGSVPDTIDYGSGEAADPTQFVPQGGTPAPPVNPPPSGLVFGPASLPTAADDFGRWGELAGSATGRGLSGDLAPSTSPSIASFGGETFVAWSDSRSGNQQIYVARHDVSGWNELGGSAGLGGISDSAGASSQPSIVVDAGGAPVVAWVESEIGGTNIHVARWEGGAWTAMGSSLGAGGISTSGTASNPIVVETSFGTLVAWEEVVAGEVQAYARVFSGGSWQELSGSASGGGISNAVTGSNVTGLTVTSDAGTIAVGWTAFDAASGIRQVYVREYAGTTWAEIAGSGSGTGVSGSLVGAVPAVVSGNTDPTLAYFDSSLWVSWVGSSDRATVLAVAEYDGSASQPLLRQTISDVGRMRTPRLSASATEMTLNWAHQPLADQPMAIYSRRFDGINFTEFIAGDAVGQGITRGSITNIESIGVASDPTAIVFVDTVDGTREIKLRRNAELTGTIHNATATGMTVQQILDAETLSAGDAITVEGTISGDITISAADSGVSIIGAAGAQIIGDITVNGDDVVLQRLNVTGDVTTTANRTAIREGVIDGTVLVNGGNQSQVSHTTIRVPAGEIGLLVVGGASETTVRSNTISGGAVGVAVGDATSTLAGSATSLAFSDNELAGSTIGLSIDQTGSGEIMQNQISAVTTGLNLDAAWTGPVSSNQITGASVGVQYDAAAELIGNRIHANVVGVVATVDSLTEGLGFVGSQVANEITNNATGLQLTGRARGQLITDNVIGVVGSGILGGEDSQFANVIENNTTGVSGFTGLIQFNRLESNQTGIAATNDQTIFRNVFVHNAVAGIDTNGAADVRISANTMHALTGDNVRVVGGSSEVEVRNNILWVESGYDIFVDNASQSGFFSDYNSLYSSGTGRLVHWIVAEDGTVLDFSDILDWQEDVHLYDLNSIGTTVVNPEWAKPQFAGLARGNYDVDPVAAGLRFTSPTENTADPLSVLDWSRVSINRLADPGFEAGLGSWTTNLAASTLGASPDPYSGSSYFFGGADATSFAEQTIDLIASGFTAAEIDARDLTAAFGGRIRSADGDTGQIVLTFLDGGNLEISSTTALASNVGDRWEQVGDRLAVPQNTRSIRYRFEGTRLSGTANDARLDDAFLYLLSEDAAVAQGADGDQQLARDLDRPEIALRSPDLYVDFQRDLPGRIEWDSFGNSDDLPVRIDLLQDTPSGPVLHTNIVAVTDDDGQHSWTPADDSIDYGTFGWRIQVSLVGDSVSFDRSTETFAVPENNNTFYVNDGSFTGDQYTTALGNNRSTGKTPSSPKPYPNNVLRIYSLGANQTLFQDAGTFHAFSPTVVSNIVGVGDDEGFTWTGPDSPASGVADNLPAHPETDSAVVLLDDSDQTTLRYLTLRDSRYGVHARAGSTAFNGEALTLRGHSEDGIYIQDNSEFTTLLDTVSENNEGYGIHLDSAIDSISGGRIEGNADDGIHATNQADLTISDIAVLNNARGIYVENVFSTGQTLIENSEIAGSSGDGLDIGAGTTIRLSAVHSNATIGIDAAREANIDQNVIFGNDIGVSAGNFSSGNITITRNRLYDNHSVGIDTWLNNVTQQNTIYSTPIGIRTHSSSGGYRGDLDRNVIYDTGQHGILLRAASNANVTGNTIYTTQGSGLRLEQNTSGTVLRNNLFTAIDSTALSFDTNSQVGIDSDFNLFHVLGTGNVALWQATPRPTLTSWRNAAFTDAQSLEQDPLFVDPLGADNALGFVDVVSDGRDDDFHLQSTIGRFTGSLAPAFDAATGRTIMLPSAELVDAMQSPAIDRGDVAFAFANEPAPNGSFVNLGAYGDSPLASKSPAQFVLVVAPDGGEVWLQNQSFDVIWRSDLVGAGTTVDITLLKDGDAGFSRLIGDDVPNNGEFSWLIPGDVLADTDYRIVVTRNDQPTLSDTSGSTFTISEPISNYYVAVTGDDANSGLSPGEPKASVAGILQAYDLEPGDTVIVGPGTYNVDSNILLQAEDNGVLIQGSTDIDGSLLTVLDRGNTATGNYVFELDGGDDIVLESLVITGAERGVYGDTASDSDRITIRGSRVSGNAREQLWIRNGNEAFTIENSEVIGLASFAGVRVESDSAVIRGNQVSRSSNGVWLTGTASLAEDNTFFDNSTGLRVERSNDTGAVVQNNRAFANSTGIYVSSLNSATTLVTGNEAFANTSVGIYSAYDVLVTNSTAWENVSIGIQATLNSVAENNVAHANGVGISAGAFSANAIIRGNTVFANDIGLRGYSSSVIEGNTAFDNRVGVTTLSSSIARVQVLNNLIYDNQDYSIEIAAGRTGTLIRNNTLYEPTASAVYLRQGSSGIELRNNLIEVQTGFAYDIDADSQSGFASDHNLIYAPGAGKLALWDVQEFDSRADWVYELGFDFNSRFGDTATDAPGFVGPSGTDGLLGYDSATIGSESIVDDGDASFSVTASSAGPATGFGGDSTLLDEDASAQWAFTGLTPGSTYEVSVTFPNGNYTSGAEYALIDSGGSVLRRIVNQRFQGLGTTNPLWLTLTDITMIGDALTIQLQDGAGTTVADAVRLREIAGDVSSD